MTIINILIASGIFFLLFMVFILVFALSARPVSRRKTTDRRPDRQRTHPGSDEPVAPN